MRQAVIDCVRCRIFGQKAPLATVDALDQSLGGLGRVERLDVAFNDCFNTDDGRSLLLFNWDVTTKTLLLGGIAPRVPVKATVFPMW